MTWKRESKGTKCTTRTKILWKRERKTDTKVKRVGRANMKQKLTGTTSPQPSECGPKWEGKEYSWVRK